MAEYHLGRLRPGCAPEICGLLDLHRGGTGHGSGVRGTGVVTGARAGSEGSDTSIGSDGGSGAGGCKRSGSGGVAGDGLALHAGEELLLPLTPGGMPPEVAAPHLPGAPGTAHDLRGAPPSALLLVASQGLAEVEAPTMSARNSTGVAATLDTIKSILLVCPAGLVLLQGGVCDVLQGTKLLSDDGLEL